MFRLRSLDGFGRGLALLLAAAALCFAGCNSGGSKGSKSGLKRIIFLTNGNSPFFTTARRGMERADAELKLEEAGLTAVLEPNDGTPEGQLNKLRHYGTQSDVAGVAVSVVDSEVVAIAEELRNLQKKGIKVVCFDSDIDRARFIDARSAFIGTNNLDAGKELGAAARHLLPGRHIVRDFRRQEGSPERQGADRRFRARSG